MQRTDARISQMCQGSFLGGSVVCAQKVGGRRAGKERDGTWKQGKAEGQLLEPRAINQGFPAEETGWPGLRVPSGESWAHGGCRASLTCKASAGAAAGWGA